MNLFRPFRMRQARSRYKFASKAKPFRVAKKEVLCGVAKGRKKQEGVASRAAGHTTGRRLNRLPEWVDPRSYITKGGRHRLFGMDYNLLQVAAFRRAGGFCECDECAMLPRRLFADWNHHLIEARGELAHNEHGPRKSDELSRVKWMRHECHMRSHNAGGKPCPKKERAA